MKPWHHVLDIQASAVRLLREGGIGKYLTQPLPPIPGTDLTWDDIAANPNELYDPTLAPAMEALTWHELLALQFKSLGVFEREPAEYLERTAKELEAAAPYWVSAEMSTMVAAAARSLPRGRDDRPHDPYADQLPQATLTPELLTTPSGFAVFEAPVTEEQLSVHVTIDGYLGGLSWYPDPDGQGIWVGWWTTSREMQGLSAPNAYIPIPPAQYWAFGEPAPTGVANMSNEAAIAIAFWLIVSQTTGKLVEVTESAVERHARKRAERAGLKSHVLRLVMLRRRPGPGHGPEGEHRQVDWSHRWLVTGHWKNQAVKAGHRLTWINPYVKGPDDKPLVVKDNIYRVDR